MSDERERAERFLDNGTFAVKSWNEIFRELEMPEPTRQLLICDLMAFAREERARAYEEAARVSCYMCREGMPLQRNGYRHNDKNGKDTVINNLCNGAVFLQRAKALREEGGRGTD